MLPVRSLVVDVVPLRDARRALIVFHTALRIGVPTLVLRSFIRDLPDALAEPARLALLRPPT